MSDGTREAAPAQGEEHKAQTAAPEPLKEEDLPKPDEQDPFDDIFKIFNRRDD